MEAKAGVATADAAMPALVLTRSTHSGFVLFSSCVENAKRLYFWGVLCGDMVVSGHNEDAKLIDFATGGVAGFLADLVTYPFDRLRTIFIVSSRHRNNWDTFIQAGGFRTLYQGFSTVALFTLPVHGVYFGLYEWTLRRFRGSEQRSGAADTLAVPVAGLVAELGTAPIWNVQEVIKQRIQAQSLQRLVPGNGTFQSPWQMFRHIVQQEGPRGLFRGFSAGLLVYAPFACVYFWIFEHGRERGRAPLVNGVLSGTCATIVTHPLEVLRTHMVVSKYPRSAWSVALDIHRRYGIRGFLKGLGARTLWLAPSAALSLAFYQHLQEVWKGNPRPMLSRAMSEPKLPGCENARIRRGLSSNRNG